MEKRPLAIILGMIIGLAGMAGPAWGADFKAAVIYDLGGKFDRSFNEAA